MKQYNGKSYIQDSKAVKKLSSTMVQTENLRTEDSHQNPLEVINTQRSHKTLHMPLPGVISVSQIPHLGKSASSSSSVDILSNNALQDLLHEKSFNGSPKNKEGMMAIEIKQYQFVGGVLTKTDPGQPMYLKSAYSTTNIQEMVALGKQSSRLGNMGSGRTLGQIAILKHQTPSSLMVSAYHINKQQQNVVVNSTLRKRNAKHYSTAPTSGVQSPHHRGGQVLKKD